MRRVCARDVCGRVVVTGATAATAACVVYTAHVRGIANEYKELRPVHGREGGGGGSGGVGSSNNSSVAPPAQPPGTPHNEPVQPMDFNPHIEWYEFPKEIFDSVYPYTREEGMRMIDEMQDSTLDELASRYGVKVNAPPLIFFWIAYVMAVSFNWYLLWSCYRTSGDEPSWNEMRSLVLSQPTVPTIEEDDIYLDLWLKLLGSGAAQLADDFWSWKPLVARDGAKTSWALPFQVPDASEWRHMTSES